MFVLTGWCWYGRDLRTRDLVLPFFKLWALAHGSFRGVAGLAHTHTHTFLGLWRLDFPPKNFLFVLLARHCHLADGARAGLILFDVPRAWPRGSLPNLRICESHRFGLHPSVCPLAQFFLFCTLVFRRPIVFAALPPTHIHLVSGVTLRFSDLILSIKYRPR